MRGIAEFAMSGRRQAATTAVLFGLVPMLSVFSAAIVALVTLRKGPGEGFLVLLWALLPALLHSVQGLKGNISPELLLIGILLTSHVLRRSASWQTALLVVTGIGLAAQLSLAFQDVFLTELKVQLQEVMDTLEQQGRASSAELAALTADDLAATMMLYYGAYHELMLVLGLILARYWQALLYNPGGFRQEFHNLRFAPAIMGLFALVLVAGMLGVQPLAAWAPVFMMVPLLSGLAVLHHVVASRKLGAPWLVLGYLVLWIATPAIMLVGLLDSVVDFRRRLQKKDAGPDA